MGALHGYGANGAHFRQMTSLDKIADAYGFIVVYPNALRNAAGDSEWRVGYEYGGEDSEPEWAHTAAEVDADVVYLTKTLVEEVRTSVLAKTKMQT